MSLREEIEALQRQLARAESDRDTWRAAGRQEKYQEAYFLVEGLQSRLDACMLRQRADPSQP